MKNIRGYIEHIRESKSANQLAKELISAILFDDFDECKRLIQAGANLDFVEAPNVVSPGDVPINWAVAKNNTNIIKLLIDAGADVNLTDSNGWSPLHVAASRGYAHSIKLLIDAGAKVNVLDKYTYRSPLHRAISNGYPKVAKLLIQASAEIDLEAQFGTFKEFSDFFGGDIKWVPQDLIPPEWYDPSKFTGTFGGFY
jgi:ankyrin repeat protein